MEDSYLEPRIDQSEPRIDQCTLNVYKNVYKALNAESPVIESATDSERASAKLLADAARGYENVFTSDTKFNYSEHDKLFDQIHDELAKLSPAQTDHVIAIADQLLLDSPYKFARSGESTWLGSRYNWNSKSAEEDHSYHASALVKGAAPSELCKN